MSRREAIRQALERPTLADRVVNWMDPVRGARRMRARVSMAVAGSYTGASKSRRSMAEWIVSGGDANADTLFDLVTLRERSRDLVRNDPIAGGAIATAVTNVVGTGLAPLPQIDFDYLGLSEDEACSWQKQAMSEWRAWAETPACDATRTDDFYGLQELAFRSTLENGDAFALLPYVQRGDDVYGLKVQLIEADRVRNPLGKPDSAELAGGVFVDTLGAPQAYHILRSHPGAARRLSLDGDTVPAFGDRTRRRNVVHLFDKLRIGQARGVPYLAGVIEPLKQLNRYTEAEIMAAVVAGLFTVFVTSEGGVGIDPAASSGMAAETGAKSGDTDVKLGNGAIVDLAPGEEVNFANPGRPNALFDPFWQAIVRQIGVRLEIPFEVLIKHYTSSYTAARAASLDAWRFFRRRRQFLAARFCQPIYETWLDEAITKSRVPAPGYFDDPLVRFAYRRCRWQGDGPGTIDPTKEAEAARERLALCLTTLEEEIAAYDGGDLEAKLTQIGRERVLKRAAGIEASAAAPSAPGADGARRGQDREGQPDRSGDPAQAPEQELPT